MLASPAETVPAPLLARIIAAMRPEQIWLFGSRAKGGARPTSDWDLLVVVSDDATDDELDLMHAWQVVRDLRIPADVIPVRRSEFEEARDHAGTLARTVVGEGRQIYGNRCSTLSIGSRRMRRHTGIQARQAA
jgi:predicted nucleotidyltransferase